MYRVKRIKRDKLSKSESRVPFLLIYTNKVQLPWMINDGSQSSLITAFHRPNQPAVTVEKKERNENVKGNVDYGLKRVKRVGLFSIKLF